MLATLAALVLVAIAEAHDEDWRKLADRLPAFRGPIVTTGHGFPGSSRAAAGQSPTGVTLLSQVPLNNFAGNQAAGNDCWGYTSPSGREYAIIGLEAGFGFVEVTDPRNPVVVATIPGPSSPWHDVKVVGRYAYGVSEGGEGIQVMDLGSIDAGVVDLVRNSQVGGHTTTHNIVANEEAGTLYLAGGNVGNGGLIRMDLTDPTRPQILGGWTEMYVHDAQVVTWNSGPFAGREIAFCASGFNGGSTRTGLRIVDMTNPTNPVVISTLFYPDAGYSHQVWVGEDQRTLYLNDELDENTGISGETTTRVVDVSDLANPALAGTFSSGSAAIDHNLYVHGGLIYQANYRSGLRVFETSDPLRPTEIGFYDTFPSSDSANFNGAWSVYPFFESGTVVVSDIERGLFVFRVDPIRPTIIFETRSPLPALIAAGGGDTIEIGIRSLQTTLDAQTVEMVLGLPSGEIRVPGTESGDGLFSFSLPEVGCSGDVVFHFEARSTEGALFSLPEDPQTERYFARPVTAVELVLQDSFDAPGGWTVSGSASDGQWTRGVPVNAGRGDPPSDADGSGFAFVTDNDASNSGNSDVDNGQTTLISPTFDTAGGAVISYSYWFDTFGTFSAGDDRLRVEISFDDGATWAVVTDHLGSSSEWRDESFLVDASEGTAATRMRFTASDIEDQNIIEAGLDAFRVDRLICEETPPCSAADLAFPFGSLQTDDLLSFVEAPFDFNADLAVDIFDLIEFFGAFDAGCP
ncbi:MAG: choice-of-anchor B family protein [Planctomycetota bacterium]